MEFILLAAALGLIPASIASKKGKSFGVWWIYGTALWIIATPHPLMMAPDLQVVENKEARDSGRVKCPSCAELVKADAVLCRFCGRELTPTSAPTVQRVRPASWQIVDGKWRKVGSDESA